MDLFDHRQSIHRPLPDRMRPKTLTAFVGQSHVVGEKKILWQMVQSKSVFSLILWGPPGVGKTTLAHILANETKSHFIATSAVTSNVKELKMLTQKAKDDQKLYGKKTILFIDEIHRFTKTQQDYLLPHVENGTITFIGATTENPSFAVISPLLSRTRVIVLKKLEAEHIENILKNALKDIDQGLGKNPVEITPKALSFLANSVNGDARAALNTLEVSHTLCLKAKGKTLDLKDMEEALQKKNLYYDKNADEHYNIISAFIKSMRGSDPDGALYWMMRMLEAGEDPLFVARRMVVFASEDIGNAMPHALTLAVSTMQAVKMIGMPECRIPLAQAATYLATAPKSNASYQAMLNVIEDVKRYGTLEVPLYLRNAPTSLMKDIGYGKGYQYAHTQPGKKVSHAHLPKELAGKKYYVPPRGVPPIPRTKP